METNRPLLKTFADATKLGRSIPLLRALAVCSALFMSTRSEAVTILVEDNNLFLSGSIAEWSPELFSIKLAETLLGLQREGDTESFVRLHLDLPEGGLASASFELVNLMRVAQAHGTKFSAHVASDATCMSGCVFLFLAADERWIAPEGKLIFHGFSSRNGETHPTVPAEYIQSYYDLLKSANEQFYEFFKASRIIEENKKVGFTGKTLFEQEVFSGLITGLVEK
ncbi:MAG: hypothetical protein NXH99_12900 [Rhodobacteraceae bacterium]|nr:hypothetical protein [Paracoccaceae bacterium]